MLTLMDEPETFLSLTTGLIEQTVAIDGTDHRFALDGTVFAVPAFDVRLLTTADRELMMLDLDLRFPDRDTVRLLAQVFGPIDGMEAMGDRGLDVRFRLHEAILDTVVRPVFGSLPDFNALLDLEDDMGPILFDLANYTYVSARL